MRDLRVVGHGHRPVCEAPRGGRVTHLGRQPDAIGQQILDLVDFLGIIREPGQHVERVGQCAFLLKGLAAGQDQRADHPVSDPFGVWSGRSQVTAGRGSLATVEADHGSDAMVAACHAGVLGDFLNYAHFGEGVIPAAGMEEQLAETALRLGAPDHEAGPVGELLGLAGRGEGPLVLIEVAQRRLPC